MVLTVFDVSPITVTILYIIQIPAITIQIVAIWCIGRKARRCAPLWITTTLIGLMWVWAGLNPAKEWILALTVGSMMNSTLIVLYGWFHYGENNSTSR